MDKIYQGLSKATNHLEILNDVFSTKNNYSDKNDYKIYIDNLDKFSKINNDIGFYKEIYSESNRQMKLADLIEYIFFSRGIFSLINNNNQLIKENIPKFIEMLLRLTNLLMVYEIMTTDIKIRKRFLKELEKAVTDIKKEGEFKKLTDWNKAVGLKKENELEGAPSSYFDSMLPKTAGGLWHEILVFAFILRYDIGYIFPLLLHQKVLSLNKKLSPPDLVILHKKINRYYGIEIGTLKERQSGGFMAPSGIPVIPLDTRNHRISDRCPTCKKWIGICPKVIKDFSDTDFSIKRTEIRCLYDCDLYSLREKLDGKCSYMKYYDRLHYHYKCVVGTKQKDIINDILRKHRIDKKELKNNLLNNKNYKNLPSGDDIRTKKINNIKTHYLWYNELAGLL